MDNIQPQVSFDLDSIANTTPTNTSTKEVSSQKWPILGEYKTPGTSESKGFWWIGLPWAWLWITLSWIIIIIFGTLTFTLKQSLDPSQASSFFVKNYKSILLTIDSFLWYPGIQDIITKTQWETTTQTLTTIENSDLPYIFKKELMDEKVNTLSQQILTSTNSLNTIQKEISKYWYLHPEIMGLLNTKEDVIPIITSLHSIDTVKFTTALKIFSYLDTFLNQASRVLWLQKSSITEQMKYYDIRWEKDIDRFLATCYLNPFEKLPDCNQIWDFANYFRYEEKDTKVDSLFLAKILMIIDSKLEQEDTPSIEIAFNRFVPNAKSLGFRVSINTLPEDDVAFLSQWIINPHIFIISTLVNLLKQSLFVIGDSINVNKLNIQQKNVTIGEIQIPISTSSMNFDLPLQKPSEREIYDYYDPILYKNENSENAKENI